MARTLPPPAGGTDGMARALAAALGEAPARVRLLETPEGRWWLKRTERLPLRWRLQKGSGRAAFEKDRAGLRLLAGAGVPVAPIVAEGPDYFVTPDLGLTLQAVLLGGAGRGERLAAFRAAGLALARLHASGYSHGRPALRDLCWDGRRVRFIDLEQFSLRRRKARHLAGDVLILIHSVFAAGGGGAELETLVGNYRAAVGPEVWARVPRLARRLGWLRAVMPGLVALRPRSRDLAAVVRTLDYVASAR